MQRPASIKVLLSAIFTGKTGGPPIYRPLTECKQFLGNTAFGLGINSSAGWYGYH